MNEAQHSPQRGRTKCAQKEFCLNKETTKKKKNTADTKAVHGAKANGNLSCSRICKNVKFSMPKGHEKRYEKSHCQL